MCVCVEMFIRSLTCGSHVFDISAREKFNQKIRTLPQPLTITAIGKLWDECCREVLGDIVRPLGGGTFSSTYGVWESSSTVRAAAAHGLHTPPTLQTF